MKNSKEILEGYKYPTWTTKSIGWECPKCGAVMNPNMLSCINCKGDNLFKCEIG